MQNSEIVILVLVFVVIVVVAMALIWLAMRRRNTRILQTRFGPEYDRTLREMGRRGPAEAALEERARRVAELEIRPLTVQERKLFSDEWHEVKAVFVDSPPEAVLHADRLLARMMQTRGYPMGDFDRRYEDLSVDHAEVARHYRAGHDIAERQARGTATTEDLRQAMKHYEGLFDGLCRGEDPPPAPPTTQAGL